MWMQDGWKSTWIPIRHWMNHVSWSLGLFSKTTSWPNTKPGDHGTPNTHNRYFIIFYHAIGPAWIEIHWKSVWLRDRSHMTSHYTWGPLYVILEVSWDGLWTLSFGLSQFHGNCSCLICEVSLGYYHALPNFYNNTTLSSVANATCLVLNTNCKLLMWCHQH